MRAFEIWIRTKDAPNSKDRGHLSAKVDNEPTHSSLEAAKQRIDELNAHVDILEYFIKEHIEMIKGA